MNNKITINSLYKLDEYGRIIIEDPVLLESVNGARYDLADKNDLPNQSCGTNMICVNTDCSKIPT